jgi:hypothetical protein
MLRKDLPSVSFEAMLTGIDIETLVKTKHINLYPVSIGTSSLLSSVQWTQAELLAFDLPKQNHLKFERRYEELKKAIPEDNSIVKVTTTTSCFSFL